MLNPGFCGDIELAPQTNADRIRAMSDEELAEFMWKTCPQDYFRTCGKFDGCFECWIDYLRQPAKDGANDV